MNQLKGNSGNGLPDNTEIAGRARSIFQGACESTDGYHASRLGQARRQAVHAEAARPAPRSWAPLAGAAACCVLVVGMVWMHPGFRTHSATPVAVSSAVTASSTAQDDDATPEIGSSKMEMVQDLDFYRWLSTQPKLASAPASNGR